MGSLIAPICSWSLLWAIDHPPQYQPPKTENFELGSKWSENESSRYKEGNSKQSIHYHTLGRAKGHQAPTATNGNTLSHPWPRQGPPSTNNNTLSHPWPRQGPLSTKSQTLSHSWPRQGPTSTKHQTLSHPKGRATKHQKQCTATPLAARCSTRAVGRAQDECTERDSQGCKTNVLSGTRRAARRMY